MKIKVLLIAIIAALCGSIGLFSQEDEEQKLFFTSDVVCFKSNEDTLGRLDVYVLMPNQSLYFVKTEQIFSAQYELNFAVIDTAGTIVDSRKIQRDIREKSYEDAIGGTAKFDYTQTIFNLKPGKYTVKVTATDNYANKNSEKSRIITMTNFAAYPFSMSGIMLISAIEERGDKFVITPHISDNIADLTDGYFAFFETYNKKAADSADFIFKILDSKENALIVSGTTRKVLKNGTAQHYLKIPYPTNIKDGSYILRIIALKPNQDTSVQQNVYLAVSDRTIKLYRSFIGSVFEDINTAIKQMRYVASNQEIEYIETAPTIDEKQNRFEEYWKKLDPSATTDRNEAFEEYYARIDFANKNFKSYTEGWRTDMGMVYIVYGKPYNIEKTQPRSDGRTYERWTYTNNKQFIFVDNSGFNDFRLYSPLTVTDKYKFEN